VKPPLRIILVASFVLAAGSGCTHTQSTAQPPAKPVHAPLPHAQRTPAAPRGTPSRMPGPQTATPAATTGPTAQAPPASPRSAVAIPRVPPNAPPQILSVSVSRTTVESGDTVSGTVLTSSNVASVEVRVATYGMALSKVGVGRFALAYTVGALPFFVHGTYPMRIIARNTRGDAAEETLPITVR
jgi:hypothetical protein